MSDFLIGVFEEATSAGARLILVRGENGQAPAPRRLERLLSSGVHGVVLAPPLGESVARPRHPARRQPARGGGGRRPPADRRDQRPHRRPPRQPGDDPPSAGPGPSADRLHRRQPRSDRQRRAPRGRPGGDRRPSRARSWSWPRAPSPTDRACARPSELLDRPIRAHRHLRQQRRHGRRDRVGGPPTPPGRAARPDGGRLRRHHRGHHPVAAADHRSPAGAADGGRGAGTPDPRPALVRTPAARRRPIMSWTTCLVERGSTAPPRRVATPPDRGGAREHV